MKGALLSAMFLAFILTSNAWPRRPRSKDPGVNNFVGDATDELSSAILQGFVDDNANLAFSPLGYSVILAILAEGSKGETRQQLVTALKLPSDQTLTRNTYFAIMDRLKNTNTYELNHPEFKNWFYVYKNYSVDPEYEKILQKYYLTEVKSVTKYEYDAKVDVKEKPEEVEQIEPLPSVEIEEPVVMEIKKTEIPKEEDLKELKPPKSGEKLISFAIEGTPDEASFAPKNIHDTIKYMKTHDDGGKSGDENDEEIMEAVEARSHQRTAKTLLGKEDVTSVLSANSVGSRSNKAATSLMIMFNGLYFRGSWRTPFHKLQELESFYVSPTEKKQVTMMKSIGSFRSGSLPGLDSTAVELPYEGGRYALLIVVPRERDGLTRLVADLPGSPLSDLQTVLQAKKLKVKIPQFNVETTTKPLTALAKFGVSSIFGPEADLTGISKIDGLFVQELVQHVSVKVVENGVTSHELTAGNPSASVRGVPVADAAENLEEFEEFSVDHPFLFFVRDVIDDLIVVAGKIITPEEPEEF